MQMDKKEHLLKKTQMKKKFQDAQKIVKNKEKLLETVMTSMGDGLSIQDRDMKIVYQNKFMRENFGNHIGEYCYNVYEKREKICEKCPIRLAYRDGKTHKALRVGQTEKGPFRFENIASVLKDDNGIVVAGMELCRIVEDREKAIDDYRKSEQELKKKNKELEQYSKESLENSKSVERINLELQSMNIELATINQELIETKEELEQSNQIKDLFTDIIRHDILNPVTTSKGAIKLFQEDTYISNLNHFKILKRNIQKIEEIVQNAAKYAQVQDKEHIEKQDMNLKQIIYEVVEDCKYLFKQVDVEIINNIQNDMPIKVNPMISEVFLNFLTNALKYAPEGKKVIIDAIVEDNGKYKLLFKDFGSGISDEDKKSLFNRFTRKERLGVKGTGLGLAIVKKTIELHNGSVWIEDNPDGGSIFVVEIPYR